MPRLLTCCLLLLCISAAAEAAQPEATAPDASATHLLENAVSFERQGRYNAALAAYEELLQYPLTGLMRERSLRRDGPIVLSARTIRPGTPTLRTAAPRIPRRPTRRRGTRDAGMESFGP